MKADLKVILIGWYILVNNCHHPINTVSVVKHDGIVHQKLQAVDVLHLQQDHLLLMMKQGESLITQHQEITMSQGTDLQQTKEHRGFMILEVH
jgi:hypothetical protein|tara:strand:- start:266 stop:544 length:279 start_codon:yes stop_codon:yes gene_type:complete